jgi:hypothetical protein
MQGRVIGVVLGILKQVDIQLTLFIGDASDVEDSDQKIGRQIVRQRGVYGVIDRKFVRRVCFGRIPRIRIFIFGCF